MQITIDTVIAFLSLILGGGGGAFFTWRWQRAKAKAEAKTAEVDATKEMQDVYQQLIADVKQDRTEQKQYIAELKQDRNELRLERNKMQKRIGQLTDAIENLKSVQFRQGRQIESLRPFLCADTSCKKRQLIAVTSIQPADVPESEESDDAEA